MSRFEALAKMLGIAADDVAKLSPEVVNTLEKVNTPEISTALKGAEREKYLNALDATYGDKAKRSADMGFDPETYYHGTGDNFDEFLNSKLGTSNGPGVTKNQHWASDNPVVAEIFAKQSANNLRDENLNKLYKPFREERESLLKVLKDQTGAPRPEGFFTMDKKSLDNMVKHGEITPEQADQIVSLNKSEYRLKSLSYASPGGSNLMPLRVNASGVPVMDAEGQHWGDVADEIGNDSIKVKNLREGRDDFFNSDMPMGTSVGLTDPSKLRSVNAAFDPRFKDSSKLLAGVSAAPAANMDPIGQLQELAEPVVSRYEKLKSMFTEPLAKQMDLTKDGSATEGIKTSLDMGLDPANLLGGIPGGLAAGIQLLGDKKKDQNNK